MCTIPTPRVPVRPHWLLALMLATPVASADTWYVDDSAPPGGDGLSWATAFDGLQAGLAACQPGDELRIGQGTYRPAAAGDRSATFLLVRNSEVRGGYAGTGAADPDARNPALWPSVLDGDLLGDDGSGFADRDDNVYNVLRCDETFPGSSYLLDGLFVRGGNADGLLGDESGGGLEAFVHPTATVVLRRCRFESNSAELAGGAVAIGAAPLTIEDCTFEGNRVLAAGPFDGVSGGAVSGGAITIIDSDFVGNRAIGGDTVLGGSIAADRVFAERTRFIDNEATGDDVRGGAVYTNTFVGGWFRECAFEGNRADGLDVWGGAADVDQHVFANCRFLGNEALGTTNAGGGAVRGRDTTYAGCLFSGNSAIATASTARGGAITDHPLSVVTEVNGCSFSLNHAGHSGGALNLQHDPVLANSVVHGNSAGAVTGQDAQLLVASNVPDPVTACCIEDWDGTLGGVGNHGLDPLFVDADGPDDMAGTADDDLRLQVGSACIDAGSVAALVADAGDVDCDGDVLEPLPLDAGYRVRRHDDPATADSGVGAAPLPDMGAFEFGASLPADAWIDEGGALGGTFGVPLLVGGGCLCSETPFELRLTEARPASLATLVLGVSVLAAPFKGGVLMPSPDVLIGGLPTGGGSLTIPLVWTDDDLSGLMLTWQFWIADASGPAGFTASNGVTSQVP